MRLHLGLSGRLNKQVCLCSILLSWCPLVLLSQDLNINNFQEILIVKKVIRITLSHKLSMILEFKNKKVYIGQTFNLLVEKNNGGHLQTINMSNKIQKIKQIKIFVKKMHASGLINNSEWNDIKGTFIN